MALAFADPATVGLSVAVDLDSNGLLVKKGQTAAASKILTINGFKTSGSYENAATVFTKILDDIAGLGYTTTSAVKKFNVGVKEVE